MSGLYTMIVRHDADCPMLLPTPGACNCEPVAELVDEAEFCATVAADARKRRAVAQAVDDLLRKARKEDRR